MELPASAANDGRILVVDVGSTAVKAAILDFRARVLTTGLGLQRTLSDGSAGREHDPATTWRAVGLAIRRALSGRIDSAAIRAISVTGPRGSFCILDNQGRTATNVITWQDRRAGLAAADLAEQVGAQFRAITGTSFDPSAVLPKLVWLRSVHPGIFADGWQATTPQGIVLARLGAPDQVVDLSTAAHFGLLDIARLAWSDQLLNQFAIPGAAMPRLVPPGTIVGHLNRTVAAALGLPANIPLLAAGSDGVCSELGAGVVAIGQLYGYLGTAAAVAGPVGSALVPSDTSLIVMPGSSSDVWRLLGLAMAGGSARDWLMANLGIRMHTRVDKLITASPRGSRGVVFIPTLAGASAPVPDGRARGAFVGLSLRSGTEDLVRALHEGVALEMRALIEAMRETLPQPVEMRLTGGGSRSDEWVRIIADVVGVRIARVREPNPGLRGAAMYALSAFGSYASVRSAAASLEPDLDLFEPELECGMLYKEAAEIYAAVRRSFHTGGVDERLFRWTSPKGGLGSR